MPLAPETTYSGDIALTEAISSRKYLEGKVLIKSNPKISFKYFVNFLVDSEVVFIFICFRFPVKIQTIPGMIGQGKEFEESGHAEMASGFAFTGQEVKQLLLTSHAERWRTILPWYYITPGNNITGKVECLNEILMKRIRKFIEQKNEGQQW